MREWGGKRRRRLALPASVAAHAPARVYERRPTLQQHCTPVLAASAHLREEKHACWALSLGCSSAHCDESRPSEPSVPHARDSGPRAKRHMPSVLPAPARESACARAAGRLRR